MKILIIDGKLICASANISVIDDNIVTDDLVFPLHIVGEYSIANVANVPDDFSPALYEYSNGILEKKQEQIVVEVPSSVTMRQARLALLSIDKLDDVATEIESLPSPQKEAAKIEWDYSSVVERNRPLVATLGVLLGLSEEELDNLFIEASKL